MSRLGQSKGETVFVQLAVSISEPGISLGWTLHLEVSVNAEGGIFFVITYMFTCPACVTYIETREIQSA